MLVDLPFTRDTQNASGQTPAKVEYVSNYPCVGALRARRTPLSGEQHFAGGAPSWTNHTVPKAARYHVPNPRMSVNPVRQLTSVCHNQTYGKTPRVPMN